MDAPARTATIVTPTYSKPDQIREAAESVFAQTYPHWRWWIILDGPTNATRRTVTEIAAHDPRVRVFVEPTTEEARRQQYRPAAILNKFLPRVATGWMCWLADDDLWHPDFLTALCGALDDHPDWDAVFCGFATYLVLRDGRLVHRYDFLDGDDRGAGTGRVCWGQVLSINTLFTKRAYDALGSARLPESWETARECDHHFMRELESQFTVHAVPRILVTNRVFAASANTRVHELVDAEIRAGGVALRPVTSDDLEFVRRLRNQNRQWSLDEAEISQAQQAEWFRGLQGDTQRAFFVVTVGGREVGTLSLTDRGDCVELGNLIVEESSRRRGIIEYACRLVMRPHVCYVARVKANNQPSRRLMEKLGVEYTVWSNGTTRPD